MKRKLLLSHLLFFLVLFTFIFPNFSHATQTSPSVNAPIALLMDANTGKIIYEKDINKKVYPASTTKIMTAILALENCALTDKAKVSYNAIFSVPSGYTNANLQVDEELTIEQLLYVLLIPSANDAANVLAEHIAGSVESFSTMMNTKAIEIGCKNTHFVNPNGVHNEDHYSTAYDLALMGQYALKHEIFQKIIMTPKYTLPVTNKYDKEDRIFNTTNRLINPKSSQYYEYATGMKTGYTVPAKNCIVASAKKDNLEFIVVILNAENEPTTTIDKFDDCINLFNYGFEHYTTKTICNKEDVYKVLSPYNASKETKTLNVLYETSITALISKEDLDKEFIPDIELDSNIKAPISKGTVIGKISYTINDIHYTTNLIAGQDIIENSTFIIGIKVFGILFFLWIIFKLLSISKKKKKKSKKKKRNSKHSYR